MECKIRSELAYIPSFDLPTTNSINIKTIDYYFETDYNKCSQ